MAHARAALALIAAFSCGFAGCSATSTEFDWDSSADFSGLETWSWVPDRRAYPDKLVQQQIDEAVILGLGNRGLRWVESGGDIQVNWTARRTDRLRAASGSTMPIDPTGAQQFEHWTGSYGTGTVDIDYYEEGTLMIDIRNPETKRVIWRGTAVRALSHSPTQERSREVIGEAVKMLLEEFPPR